MVSIGVNTKCFALFIQGTNTPVIIASVRPCIFIVAGKGRINRLSPCTVRSRLGIIFLLRRMCHQLDLIFSRSKHRNPMVDRINRHLEIRHTVKFIEERFVRYRYFFRNNNFLCIRKDTDRLFF